MNRRVFLVAILSLAVGLVYAQDRPLGHGIAAIDWQWMLDFAAPYLER